MKESTAKKLLKHVSDSYNQIADEFSDTRNHSWDEFKYFKKYLFPSAEIIDLGCGNGRLIDFLYSHYLSNDFHYIGVDNSTGLLRNAQKKNPKAVFLPGDQLSIPVDENSADIILNIAAFHHIPSYSLRLQALFEMQRVLKPGGTLIITVWNLWQKKYFWQNAKAWLKFITSFGDYSPNDLFIPWKNGNKEIKSQRYYHNFVPAELNSLLKKAGFHLIENFSVRKGNKVPFLKSFNYCIIAQKDHETE